MVNILYAGHRGKGKSLRHTYARCCLEGEEGCTAITIDQLSRALGHSRVGTTEEYYGWMANDVMTRSLAAAVSHVQAAPTADQSTKILRLRAEVEALRRTANRPLLSPFDSPPDSLTTHRKFSDA